MKGEQFYILLTEEEAVKVRRGQLKLFISQYLNPQDCSYVLTELAHRHDAFIFMDKKTPLKAFSGSFEKGIFSDAWLVGV